MMYKIIYKKMNGEVFERERLTLPVQSVGEYTSMGWLILDIKFLYNQKWYSSTTEYADYKKSKRDSKVCI